MHGRGPASIAFAAVGEDSAVGGLQPPAPHFYSAAHKLTKAMVEDQFGIRKKQAKRMLAPLVLDGLIVFVRAP